MEEERKLILGAKDGDEEAFGRLYDKYMPAIYRFIFLKVGGDKGRAEDISHEVFLSAWQSMNRYEFRGFPFSSWLYRIANNAVIDYYRTWKNTQNIETVSEEFVAETPELAKEIDDSFDLRIVQTALKKLEPDQQSVLIMKFIDDLSNKEIAEAISKSEGAVRVIQHRALKQLKKYVDESKLYSSTKEA